jgi:hypothetical protein
MMLAVEVKERLAAWQAAGIVDGDTAARIEAFEAARPPAERAPGRITVSEVIAYVGAVVLLVGMGFLYGTQYANLGTTGRLIVIALVAIAGFAAGELVKRTGAHAAARRARAAGWSVGALAVAAGLAQLLVDNDIFARPPQYPYPGAPDDLTGSWLVAAGVGAVIALVLLWRAGAGLLAFVLALLTYITAGVLLAYLRMQQPGWGGEVAFLVAGGALAGASELVTRGPERTWAREVLRFFSLLVPVLFALVLSAQPDDVTLEVFAGLLAVAGFGLALARVSAGYAIAAGVALFVFVNEVGFRHFSDALGFPVVLIISGIALFVIAGGLVGLLRRVRPRV